jgi:hypothetical protein
MSRRFIYDATIGHMLGLEGVTYTPGAIGKYLWENTGGAFIDGLTGNVTAEETKAAADANLVRQSDILLENT